MKCPECNRDIGYHALEKNAKGCAGAGDQVVPEHGPAGGPGPTGNAVMRGGPGA